MRRILALALGLASVALAGCTSREPGCARPNEPCVSSTSCGDGYACEHVTWTFGRGDVCLRSCQDERDCPRIGGSEWRCIDLARDGTFRCYQGCAGSEACPEGFVCQPIRTPVGGGGICLP